MNSTTLRNGNTTSKRKSASRLSTKENFNRLLRAKQEIVKSLDLTKNQAANNMDGANPASDDEAVAASVSVNHTESHTRRSAPVRV